MPCKNEMLLSRVDMLCVTSFLHISLEGVAKKRLPSGLARHGHCMCHWQCPGKGTWKECEGWVWAGGWGILAGPTLEAPERQDREGTSSLTRPTPTVEKNLRLNK